MSESAKGTPLRLLGLLLAFGAAVALALPSLWSSHGQLAALRSETDALRRQIEQLDQAAADIRHAEAARNRLMERFVLFDVLGDERQNAIRLLNILGSLPDGVWLHAVAAHGNDIVLIASMQRGEDLQAALTALESAGLTDVLPTEDGSAQGGPIEIRARFDPRRGPHESHRLPAAEVDALAFRESQR